jgi:hypothetical protein
MINEYHSSSSIKIINHHHPPPPPPPLVLSHYTRKMAPGCWSGAYVPVDVLSVDTDLAYVRSSAGGGRKRRWWQVEGEEEVEMRAEWTRRTSGEIHGI